jgi:chitinase
LASLQLTDRELFSHCRAPGTAANGTNGCISNCGTLVVSSNQAVATPRRVAYFDPGNTKRFCGNVDITKITDGGGQYTHVHYAFANITQDWEVDVSAAQDQFDGLRGLQGIQRILSFGGSGYSTDAYTFQVMRNGVLDGNRQKLAANIVNFLANNTLDGVDFDWEYPGVIQSSDPGARLLPA